MQAHEGEVRSSWAGLPRRILVPVDLSASTDAALENASFWRELCAPHLEVLHVWKPPGLDVGVALVSLSREGRDSVLAEGRAYAARELADFMQASPSRIQDAELSIEVGAPAEVICRVARERRHDLIVMATHQRTGLDRILLGNVSQAVLRNAPCPVLTVPSRQR
jgi:nucleotide-binding universal stress UspA family protein